MDKNAPLTRHSYFKMSILKEYLIAKYKISNFEVGILEKIFELFILFQNNYSKIYFFIVYDRSTLSDIS